MSKNERTVEFGYLPEGQQRVAINQQQQQDSNISLGAIADAVPRFTAVQLYTTFDAEWALQDENIVVHFFLPKDFRGDASNYWTQRFPTALDAVARAYFSADRPRLQAKYTQELNSWWFRAMSYAHVIDLTR